MAVGTQLMVDMLPPGLLASPVPTQQDRGTRSLRLGSADQRTARGTPGPNTSLPALSPGMRDLDR